MSDLLAKATRAAALERLATEYMRLASFTEDPAERQEYVEDALAAQHRRLELLGVV